jgi:hypothetical protein
MSDPHRIRLRGPWEVLALESCAANAAPARMMIPCTWREGGWVGFRGRARHCRSFGKPRQFDPDERIWLVVESVTGVANVRLNGQEIGQIAGSTGLECDVTECLQARNQLEIDVMSDTDDGGVTGEVRIEIRH